MPSYSTATTQRRSTAMSHRLGSDEYNWLGELLASCGVTADQAGDRLEVRRSAPA
jgi:hypothetical protein